MISVILSHLVAAIAPLLLILGIKFYKQKKQYIRKRNSFWKRQNNDNLKKTGLLSDKHVAEPFLLLFERQSLQTAIQIISLGIELDLFELIDEHPGFTNKDLAKKVNISEPQAAAVAELLTASNVLKVVNGYYMLTPTARLYLLKNSPFFIPLPPPVYARRMLRLAKSKIAKGTVQKWHKGKSAEAEQWALKQHSYSFPLGFALHQSGLLDSAVNSMDVAGGAGSVCIALALNNPNRKLSLLELPGSIPIAKKMIAKYELSERIQCIGLDMFNDTWPSHQDAILFTNIFHDWNDEQCLTLAKKAFASLKPGGSVFIQEALLYEDKPGPLWTAHWSLIMAFTMQGRQFRASELKTLLQKSRFINVNVHPLLGYYFSVTAQKP